MREVPRQWAQVPIGTGLLLPADPDVAMRVLRVAAAALFALVLTGAGVPPLRATDLAVVDVTLVDAEQGDLRPATTVLISGDRIAAVGPSGKIPLAEATRVIDGRGLFVIPGLWDMHVHSLWDREVADAFLPLFVVNGVTGIRDMGGRLEVLAAVREGATRWRTLYPRIVAAGPILDGPTPVDPSVSMAIGTVEEAERAIRRLAAAEVDLLKVYTLLPRDAYLAILKAAGPLGLPVVGHVPAEVTPAEAAALGQASIEHLRDEIEPYCGNPASASCEALFETFRRFDTHQVPTLAVLQAKTRPGYLAAAPPPELALLPEGLRAEWGALAATHRESHDAEYFERRRQTFLGELRLVGALRQHGVPILAGSDTGNPYILPAPACTTSSSCCCEPV